jgi:phosphatidylserine/phosphatidylglycerophosphate/cardiolipin synthase-like enzyme
VSTRAAVLAVALVAVVAVPAGSPATAATPSSDAAVVAVYPNPVADGDDGEFVVVTTPAGGNLTDGETTVRVPAGTVAVTPDPTAASLLVDRRLVHAPSLSLSNDGERVAVVADGRVLAERRYADAPEGERLGPDGEWRPLGLDPRPVRSHGPACATAFVLPDAPAVPLRALRGAERRVLLAGYTFTSRRIGDALVAAHRRGVRVRVLVDGAPVGGATTRQAAVLDRLGAAGVDVQVVAGERARFAFHHPKYAVVDDTALVTTENWKPGGTGGHDSRGWGVRVANAALAADLAGLFRSDAGWHDTRPWSDYRESRSFRRAPAANGSYPGRFEPRSATVRDVSVLTAPGNAEAGLVDVLDGASDRVDVVQPTVGSLDQPFVNATLRAARRGVRVRVLLSGAWYAREENSRLAAHLNDRADRRGLPLTVRLADPGRRFGKVHAKGVVADDTVVVGSLNWNNHSARENREVALALRGPAVASYYRRVFTADWRGRERVPAGVLLAVALVVGVALAVARRRVRFTTRRDDGPVDCGPTDRPLDRPPPDAAGSPDPPGGSADGAGRRRADRRRGDDRRDRPGSHR